MNTQTVNEYSIAFYGNKTIYATSEQEARAMFNSYYHNSHLHESAEIDTVTLQSVTEEQAK